MIYLASGSPRRADLLRQINVDFELLAVEIDESFHRHEAPAEYVKRMARSKALAGYQSLSERVEGALVLGADTIIAIDDKIIGKPVDREQCGCILAMLSGREHQVLSAIAVAKENDILCRLSTSQVWFKSLSTAEIEQYCASEEPMDKAGAYAIQGRAAIFIKSLAGSYSSVMGLPLYETAGLLKEAGVSV
jgi:septum formation protein